MWYFNGETIKTPRAMQIGDLKYSRGLFKDATKMAELGIKPYSQVTPDNRYYHNGAYTVDTSGAEVVGTYAGTAKDVATLKASMLEEINTQLSGRLGAIDWYWARADKGNDAVPSAIATYATTLYSEKDTKESEVAALDTLAKIIEYEARAYTQVDKVKVYNEDGSFKEYHASDTTSTARSINMLHHWTVHPDDVDAGLVSLTAD